MNDNPYESPRATDGRNVNAIVRPPAILLLVLVVVTLLFELAIGFTVVIDTLRFIGHYGVVEGAFRAAPFVLSFGLVFVMHIVVFIGTINMCRMTGYRGAKAAAIISLIPVLSPGYLLGIPIGIWALLALREPGVKEEFLANAT